MNINYKSIGERVRAFRRQKGMTQEQLAEFAALTSVSISFIETGKKNPSLSSVLKIAFVFEITTEELLKEVVTQES